MSGCSDGLCIAGDWRTLSESCTACESSVQSGRSGAFRLSCMPMSRKSLAWRNFTHMVSEENLALPAQHVCIVTCHYSSARMHCMPLQPSMHALHAVTDQHACSACHYSPACMQCMSLQLSMHALHAIAAQHATMAMSSGVASPSLGPAACCHRARRASSLRSRWSSACLDPARSSSIHQKSRASSLDGQSAKYINVKA